MLSAAPATPVLASNAQGMLDQKLGLGPGDEHAAIHGKFQAIEFAVAEDVGQGFAFRAAGHQVR